MHAGHSSGGCTDDQIVSYLVGNDTKSRNASGKPPYDLGVALYLLPMHEVYVVKDIHLCPAAAYPIPSR